MITKYAFTGSYTENPFWYQQFDLRKFRKLRGGQPIVDIDAAGNCRLYVTTMEAMNFQDVIPSIPIDKFKDHYVLVFDLTSMQDATESCHYPELVGQPLRLELNPIFPLEHIRVIVILWERMSSLAVDKFGFVGKKRLKWIIYLQPVIKPFPNTQVPVPCLFSLGICSNSWQWHFCHYRNATQQSAGWTLDNDCKLSSNFVFADSLGRKKCSFLKQQYEQMTPEPLQSHPSVCGLYTISAAFHLSKIRQEEITGVHDVKIPSFISNYMYYFDFFYVNKQVIQCLCYYLYNLINFLKH